MHQIGTQTTNFQPKDQYVILAKQKSTSRKLAGLNKKSTKIHRNNGTRRDRRKRHRQIVKCNNRNKTPNRLNKSRYHDGTEKEIILDTETSVEIISPDTEILENKKILPMTSNYQDINNKEVKLA